MTDPSALEQNKAVVREFYDLAFNQQQPREAARRFLGETYTQHYPATADGREAFVDFVTGFVKAFPALRVSFKHIVAEGNLVAVYSHVVPEPGRNGMAAFDLFRLEDGKLVEHWGVDTPVPDMTASGNAMF